MSRADKALLLSEECAHVQAAVSHLRVSVGRVAGLMPRLRGGLSPEDLERFESLASRFARVADLLIQRIFRLVDELELLPAGSLLDRIHRAEKRGWVEQAHVLVRIRELRNLIAHDYAAEQMADIYEAVYQLAPVLASVAERACGGAQDLVRGLSGMGTHPPTG